MKIDPNLKIYLMEKWVMNRDYPVPTYRWGDKKDVIEPYHDGWFLIAFETSDGRLSFEKEFQTLEALAKFLIPLSKTHKILRERQNNYSELVDIEGDLEKVCELSYNCAEKLKRMGVLLPDIQLLS